MRDGLLSFEARDAPLQQVLQEIAQEAHFKIILHGDLTSTVTQSVTGRPLADGLSRLLEQATNFAIVYSQDGDVGGSGRLRELHVYPASRPADRPLRVAPAAQDPADGIAAPAPDVRLEAIRAPAREAGVQAVPALARLLEEDDDPAVRGQAAAQLGEIGTADAIPALQAALADQHESVRLRAVRALGAIGGDDSARVLTDILLFHSGLRMQLLAAAQLARSDSPIARSSLRAATTSPVEAVRSAATRYLELGSRQLLDRPADPRLSRRPESAW